MRKFGFLLGMLLIMAISAFAQDIKEIDGIYFKGNTPYSGDFTIFHENGVPKIELLLVEGMKEGAVKVYFENGTLSEIRSYKKNVMDGTWLTFNEKKVRIAEAHYLDGKKDGKWYIWDDDGRLIYELEYTNGEKTGNWKKYDTAGNVISERNYSIK
ncbi:MAG TPA: toxin-antitoxin system YwqK family antitoxin [Prolixibacteraceae bacterium]|nr:toxin-antitoxin system YwqK family antitoxin [Prolixibacteraceae bacterium]